MSNSLVRKALDLFQDDLDEQEDTSKKRKKKSTDPMKMISTKKKGVHKELKQLKQQQQRAKKPKKKTSALETYRQTRPQDHTEETLYYMHSLMKMEAADSAATEKVLAHTRGRLSKDRQPEERKTTEKSLFTDRDFDQFEKEYDFD